MTKIHGMVYIVVGVLLIAGVQYFTQTRSDDSLSTPLALPPTSPSLEPRLVQVPAPHRSIPVYMSGCPPASC